MKWSIASSWKRGGGVQLSFGLNQTVDALQMASRGRYVQRSFAILYYDTKEKNKSHEY
jgi:hypothetical protein